MPTLPAGLWVHYSAPGAGGGLVAAGSAGSSYGGYLSTTAIPTGTDISHFFPQYRRFQRADEYTYRGYARCLFVVNNTGASVTCGVGVTFDPDSDLGDLSNGPATAYTALWDVAAASAWDSASPQADTWQPGPWTAAQLDAGDAPNWTFTPTKTIPQGSCAGFWIAFTVRSFFSPATNTTRSFGGSVEVATL